MDRANYYTEEILQRDELRTLTNDETFRKLGEAFAQADEAQTGTIDKFGLATVLGQDRLKIYFFFHSRKLFKTIIYKQ